MIDMSIRAAIQCFEALFGDAREEPEKFNLYNGLVQMAHAVQQLETEVRAVKQQVERRLSELRR